MTMKHEVGLENAMGAGDSWTLSGGQWGAWNATYGPRGADGKPVALWDPKTGAIDRSVVEHWKKYDLRLTLEQNWPVLAPKLKGKIHIWVGEADNYFLNNAAHMLDGFLSKATPSYDGNIAYGPGMGHCWVGLTERQIQDQMAAAIAAGAPAASVSSPASIPTAVLGLATNVWILRRFGLLALVAMVCENGVVQNFPFTAAPCYAPLALTTPLLVASLAAWSLYVILTSRPGTASRSAAEPLV